MPGIGNATIYGKSPIHDYILPNIWIATGLLVVGLEITGLARFYWTQKELANSWESYLISAYFFLSDIPIFVGLYKTKHYNPGYLLPSQSKSEKGALI